MGWFLAAVVLLGMIAERLLTNFINREELRSHGANMIPLLGAYYARTGVIWVVIITVIGGVVYSLPWTL